MRSGKELEEPHQKEEIEEKTMIKEPTNSKEQATKVHRSPKQLADGWSLGIKFADLNMKHYKLLPPFPER